MLRENTSMTSRDQEAPFCAIRKRKPDGSPNVGGRWAEPMCSVTEFVENQREWEVVFYNTGDKLPA